MTPTGEANPITRLVAVLKAIPTEPAEPIGNYLVAIFETPEGPARLARAYAQLVDSAHRAHLYVETYAHERSRGEWLKPFGQVLHHLEQNSGSAPTNKVMGSIARYIAPIEAFGYGLPLGEAGDIRNLESVQQLIEQLNRTITETQGASLPTDIKRYTILLLNRLITDLRQYIYVGEEQLQRDLQALMGQLAVASRVGLDEKPENAAWWANMAQVVGMTEILLSIYVNAHQALPPIVETIKQVTGG